MCSLSDVAHDLWLSLKLDVCWFYRVFNSVTSVFSLSTQKESIKVKLEEDALPQVDTNSFLGVKLDSRLTWKPNLEEMEARGRRRLAIMRKLSGTTWGANSKILKTVFTGSVRPALEYASTSWCTAAETNKAKLDKIQNERSLVQSKQPLSQRC